jgi:hypothetical protein
MPVRREFWKDGVKQAYSLLGEPCHSTLLNNRHAHASVMQPVRGDTVQARMDGALAVDSEHWLASALGLLCKHSVRWDCTVNT